MFPSGFSWTQGDNYAHWENWWSELGLTFSNLTGPLAPHLSLLCNGSFDVCF